MPISVYRRRNPNQTLAEAITAGTQGFAQGQQLRRQNEETALSNAYKQAQIQELNRKLSAYGQAPNIDPNEPLYFDPIEGAYKSTPGYFNVSKEREKAAIKAEEDARAMAMFQGIGNTQGGGAPVGTTMRLGRYNIPLNPKLTGEESSAIAASEVFPPLAEGLKQKTKEGVFESKFKPFGLPIGRTYRQIVAGQPNALFTAHDPKLQEVQGKINSLRRYVFGEGGKQLTPYEANIVNALINPKGKSDVQYETDLDEATKLIQSKSKLALGGANTARTGGLPKREKTSGQIMTDAQGNKAMVYPDGSFEEI